MVTENETTDDLDGNGEEPDSRHQIKVESTQVYRSVVTPEQAELLTGDGDPPESKLWSGTQSFPMEFHKELKCTYECSCGDRFRKPETAREHLEEVR